MEDITIVAARQQVAVRSRRWMVEPGNRQVDPLGGFGKPAREP